ncbi:MAG TPA: sugar ABC transporter ATP-binding protein [Anaerolineaceae bacterium]|nr:sugar ABC transporter ATP-binding protein [Anaerolineaceae bacterium]
MSVSLSARNIVKHYGGVVAISDANLDVHTGEVVALIGANGSGKSTLSKIINGVVVLDGGQLLLDEKPVHFSSPQAAKNLGISTVFQELSLIPQMTVAENIWLTREPLNKAGLVDRKTVNARTEELLALFEGTYKNSLNPDITVGALPADEKQIIEILKAICFNPRLIILDEATASLDRRQVQRLFELIAQWKLEDKAVIFVSHRMEEIFRIADTFSVLRNGVTVGSGSMKDISEKELVNLMVAKESASNVVQRERLVQENSTDRKVRLEVENLRTNILKNISLQLKDGELLGVGGLVGQGQKDLLLALFGDLPYEGTVKISNESVHFKNTRQAINKGVALVPGERSKEGLLYIRSILENLLLPSWGKYGFPTKIKKAVQDSQEISTSLNLKMAGLDEPVSSLSGGNAQKVVIGKWLLRKPKLLLLDDPTKGVDVGTKAEFYKLLERLCADGTAILFYSSDDDELIGLCDRVMVMHDGIMRSELKGASLTKSNLIGASLGATNEGMG